MEKIGDVKATIGYVSKTAEEAAIGRCSIVHQYIKVGCRSLRTSKRVLKRDLGASLGREALGITCCFQGFELLFRYIEARENLEVDRKLNKDGQHGVTHYIAAIRENKATELENYIRNQMEPDSMYCPKQFWSSLIIELQKQFMQARYLGVGDNRLTMISPPAHHIAHVYNAFVDVYGYDGLSKIAV